METKTTSERIKEIIARAGMSQNKFADAFGIPRNTVHNWAQGVNEPPAYLIRLLENEVARLVEQEKE